MLVKAGQPDRSVRLVSTGAALLSLAVLSDSAVEHYRGSFRNPAMVLPLIASTLSIGIAGERTANVRSERLPGIRGIIEAGSASVGMFGLGFHAFNIIKRPGELTFGNFFYGAPIGAPAALVLASALNVAADALSKPDARFGSVSLSSGRVLGALTAAGIAGTVGEAGLLHFRGAYHNPAMWLPVALPPIAALSLARDAATGHPRSATIGLLTATAALGLIGVGFHIYGVSRRMGGWRNWRQNILAGPPIPAPPSFTGLAIAALGAMLMMRKAANG